MSNTMVLIVHPCDVSIRDKAGDGIAGNPSFSKSTITWHLNL
jgi:hypothetical protein